MVIWNWYGVLEIYSFYMYQYPDRLWKGEGAKVLKHPVHKRSPWRFIRSDKISVKFKLKSNPPLLVMTGALPVVEKQKIQDVTLWYFSAIHCQITSGKCRVLNLKSEFAILSQSSNRGHWARRSRKKKMMIDLYLFCVRRKLKQDLYDLPWIYILNGSGSLLSKNNLL